MHTRLSSVLFFSLIFIPAAFSQKDTLNPDFRVKGTAIGISSPELIQEMMVTMEGIGSNAKEIMKQQSVKAYLMPPRQAGGEPTLMSYVLSACMEFYSNYGKNYKVNLSPDYVALNLSREDKADLKNALRFLVTEGTVSADIVPYGSPSIPRSAGATDKFRITNYLQIFRDTHRSSQKVFEVQKALMRGNPVIVELRVPKDFSEVSKTRFWTEAGSDMRDSEVLQFLVVSYNLELESFEVLSSWGTNWGSDGYLWLNFEDFGNLAQNGYVMVPAEN